MILLAELNFSLPWTNPVLIFSSILFIILFAPLILNKLKIPQIIGLIIALLVTAILVWLVQQGKVPAPFAWVVYAILIVIWLVVLLGLTGLGGQIGLGQRIG